MTENAIRPFKAAPIVHPVNCRPETSPLRATFKTAERAFRYNNRLRGGDILGNHPETWLEKDDLVAFGRCAPSGRLRKDERIACPAIWRAADEKARDLQDGAATAYSIVASLPPGCPPSEMQRIIELWAREAVTTSGMIADWSIHDPVRDDDRSPMPHAHILVTLRGWRRGKQNTGWRNPNWLASEDAVRGLEDLWLSLTGFRDVPSYRKGAK